MDEIIIKNCPKCGKQPETIRNKLLPWFYRCMCMYCKIGPFGYKTSIIGAQRAWNKYVPKFIHGFNEAFKRHLLKEKNKSAVNNRKRN